MKKSLSVIMLAFICCFGLFLAGCTDTPGKYSISVYINGANYGTVEDVSGEYLEGTDVTITATPFSNQEFFCWMHDNKVVSTESEFTFTVGKETSGSYVALFKCPDLEYYYLDGLTFNNAVPSSYENSAYTLKELSVNFGYSQNTLINVYTCTDEDLLLAETFEANNEAINSTNLPHIFNKTQNLYINVIAKYTSITDGAELEYVSNTMFILSKTTNIGPNSTLNQVQNQKLELTKNEANANLPSLEADEVQSTISLNFKKLAEFPFETETEGEEE